MDWRTQWTGSDALLENPLSTREESVIVSLCQSTASSSIIIILIQWSLCCGSAGDHQPVGLSLLRLFYWW